MNFRKVSFYLLLLTVISCSKKNDNIEEDSAGKDENTRPVYSVTEDFELGEKQSYAADHVTLSTGTWYFDDALLGSLDSDAKDGSQSVRLRNGSITMNFDVDSMTMLYIDHAVFGSDGASTWKLYMSDNGGVTFSLLGSVTDSGTTLVTDSFSINTYSGVRFKIAKEGTDRVNLDNITFKGVGDSGITLSTPDDSSNDDGDGSGSDAATPRTVTAGDDAQPDSGDNSNMLLGNPSGAQNSILYNENYLVDFSYYTESYNATRAEPNWVSWHLGSEDITGAASRQDNFAAWADLPSGWYQVQSNSYSGSGFDRGHNCPSADRTSSVNANSATFLMTNMIPQAPNNNQKTWANLESYLRGLVDDGEEIYIIMGSYGEGGTGTNGAYTTIDDGNITVPSNVWKIAVILDAGDSDLSRIDENTQVLAVDTPNSNDIKSDWRNYIVTVREIEEATGYNFLSELSQTLQDELETRKYTEN